MRECAGRFDKDNFFIPGEITSGNNLGSIYLGRGRTPDHKPRSVQDAIQPLAKDLGNKHFLRENGLQALDAGAFHYSIYRYLTRFLGMAGNLEAGFDLPLDWVDAW